MVVDFGPRFSKKTSTATNSGGEGSWTDLRYRCDVTVEDLFAQPLSVKVFDENHMVAHTLIGSTVFPLKKLAYPEFFGSDHDVPLQLLGPKGILSGRLILRCGLHHVEEEKEKEKAVVTQGFEKGVLHVKKIRGREMQGGGLFSASIGELTTYIKLKAMHPNNTTNVNNIGEGLVKDTDPWSGITGPRTGHSPVWDVLDIKVPVTASSLLQNKLTVECWARTLGGLVGDKLLGSGTISMLPAGDTSVSLFRILFHYSFYSTLFSYIAFSSWQF